LVRTASGKRAQCGDGCLPWHIDTFPFWPDHVVMTFGLNSPGPSDCCWQNSILVEFSSPVLGAMATVGGAVLTPTLRGLFTANYRLAESITCNGSPVTLIHNVGITAGPGGDFTASTFTLTLDVAFKMQFLQTACALPLRFIGCEAYRMFEAVVHGPWDICDDPLVVFSGAVSATYPHPTHPCVGNWSNYTFAVEPA